MPNHQSKIEKLISELCLNGVEFKKFGEVCEIADNKRRPVASSLRVIGKIPYYGANNIQDYVEGFTHEGDFVLIAEDGSASLENYSIQFATRKFWANNHVHVVRGLDKLNNRFLFHYLRSMNFTPFLTGGTRAKLTKSKMLEIKIPLPPLAIQEEIVKILDSFTELEAELELELEARKKQYEYYRDGLLNIKDVEYKALGEVCFIASGGTPSKSKIKYWENGTIPWLKSESCKNQPVYSATNFITENGLKNSSAKLLDSSTTLMALVGATIFKTAFLEFKTATNQNIASIKSKDSLRLNDKYIFYYLTNLYQELKSSMADYGMLNLTTLRSFKIPIPPIVEQERIVSILDKFDALVNDISIGLPAELKARRQQYEYYRGKLLTFKES